MPNLKKIQPAAKYRGELFNREINAALATSRASGSSARARMAVLVPLIRAMAQDRSTLVGYVPPVPKILKPIGIFRRRQKDAPRKPCRAEPEVILTSSTGQKYLRLDNGQIVRAVAGADTLFAFSPGSDVFLRKADIDQLAQQELPRS